MLWTCHWLGRAENRAGNTSRVVTPYRTCLAILSAFPAKSSLLCSTALRLGAGMVIRAQPPRAYCQAMPGPGPVQNARCPATSGTRWLICSFDPGQLRPLAEPVRWHCPRAYTASDQSGPRWPASMYDSVGVIPPERNDSPAG